MNIPRFAATLRSMPQLRTLYFDDEELEVGDGRPRSMAGLAARYAAKEAVGKALAVPPGLQHRDCVVRNDPDGRPWLDIRGSVLDAARALNVTRWHVSLSQEGNVAVAYVVADGRSSLDAPEMS